MAWDEVCVLCGIRPLCGPVWLLPYVHEDTAAEAKSIASEISSPADEATIATLHDLLQRKSLLGELPELEGRIRLGYSADCLAIGLFDAYGTYVPCAHHGGSKHPTGDAVSVRRVHHDGSHIFMDLVTVRDGQRHIENSRPSFCRSRVNPESFSIWVHLECGAYLEAWLQCPLPPRIGRNGQSLAPLAELYELVNSQRDQPVRGEVALACIDYGGTMDSARYDDRFQDFAISMRRGSKHTAKALREGSSGDGLLYALLEDCRYWTWIRPDIWPTRPSPLPELTPILTTYVAEQPQSPIARLPQELLAEVLQDLEFLSIFTLAMTCKHLYGRIMNRSMLIHHLLYSMTHADGPMRWIFPIAQLPEEHERAYKAMVTWIPWDLEVIVDTPVTFNEALFEEEEDDGEYLPDGCQHDDMSDPDSDDGRSDSAEADLDEEFERGPILDVPVPPSTTPGERPQKPLPLFDSTFPLFAFLRTCYTDDSMRSRRRRWMLIKQFDELWANYRAHGWQRDSFAPPGVVWDVGEPGRLSCQCDRGV